MKLDESDPRDWFINAYVAGFLSARAALMYEECCAMDQHDRLTKAAVEDAVHLAVSAWIQCNEFDFHELVETSARLLSKENP